MSPQVRRAAQGPQRNKWTQRTASEIKAERAVDRCLRSWQTSKSARASLSARCNYRALSLSPFAKSHCSALVFTLSSLPLSARRFFSSAGPYVLWRHLGAAHIAVAGFSDKVQRCCGFEVDEAGGGGSGAEPARESCPSRGELEEYS